MTTATLTTRQANVQISSALLAGLIAGIASAVINNLYHALYVSATGNTFPELSLISIALVSLIPSVLGGLVYYALTRFTPRARLVFTVLGLAFAVLTIAPQFVQPLHPGFGWAIAPLHLIAGVSAVLLIPRLARR
jgi:hypothetical protein